MKVTTRLVLSFVTSTQPTSSPAAVSSFRAVSGQLKVTGGGTEQGRTETPAAAQWESHSRVHFRVTEEAPAFELPAP